MSFHTLLWVHPYDGEALDIASIAPAIERFLDENGIHRDTVESLQQACASAFPSFEPTLFSLDGAFLAVLFEFIARQLPASSFTVRGVGEEPRDVWVREFSGGELQFEAGPFES